MFEKGDDLLQADNDGVNWLEYVLSHNEKLHKVSMLRNGSSRLFIVWAKELLFDNKQRSVVLFTDITNLENAYMEVHRQEKIMIAQSRHAAMGEMISVIAHQLKQPLSVISILLNRIILNTELDQFSKENVVENIGAASKHISLMYSTIDDFRYFFKPNKEYKSFLLEHCIHSVLNLLTPILQENNISVVYETDISIELVSLENELFHVVMNIINNAKDILVTKQVKAPMIYINVTKNSDNLVLTIEDNAGGIEEAIIDKVFDQYFTTKENTGTGLGLHISIMIVEERLGGRLSVSNGKYVAKF